MNAADNHREAERILVLVLGNLADAVLALAPLSALRAHHAEAHITVLTTLDSVRLFAHCPFVDRIDARWPIAKPMDRVKFHWSVRNARYDMVYDLTNSSETEGLFRALQPFPPNWSGQVIGCSHPHADRSRLTLHRLDRHAEQLMVCGIGPKHGYAQGLSPLPDLSWTKPLGGDPDLNPAENYGINGAFALLIPQGQAQDPDAIWPTARFGELAQAMIVRDIIPVIVGGPDALPLVADIRAQAPASLDLVTQVDLFGFIALAQQSALIIGSDSDMIVLAAAAGGPTLAIVPARESNAQQGVPRGAMSVGLVARNIQSVGVADVLSTARAVAPWLANTQSSVQA